MIIGIDGNEANTKRLVGIGEYAFELLSEFSRQKHQHKIVVYLKAKPLSHMPPETDTFQYEVFGPSRLWTQFGLPIHLLLSREKPSVFFSPSHYVPRLSPAPRVMAIMDVSYVQYPQLFKAKDLYQLKHWTAYSVKKAKKILTISEASKSDIIKEYNVTKDSVEVIYPGVKPIRALSPELFTMDRLQRDYGIAKNYILFVGTLQPRKNLLRLIEAFSQVLKKKNVPDDLQLVIVGKKGWLFEEILSAPEKYNIVDRIKFLDFVSDEELPALYKNAICYVLPSLYEGFGLPVLEAMKYGCPVITSNISSLPEAAGDAALFVNPEKTEEIENALEKVITDEKLREVLIQKGYKQIKKFSWEKAASETLRVLEDVGGGK